MKQVNSHMLDTFTRAVKRKGFGQQPEGGKLDGTTSGGNNGATASAFSGAGQSSSSAPGTATNEPSKTGPEIRKDFSERLGSSSVSQMSNMSSHSGAPHSNSSAANDSVKDLPVVQVRFGSFYGFDVIQEYWHL